MERIKITEREFQENEEKRLRALADEVADFLVLYGLSAANLARACNFDKRLVRRAKNGVRISGQSEARLRYLMDKLGDCTPLEIDAARQAGLNPFGLFAKRDEEKPGLPSTEDAAPEDTDNNQQTSIS